MPQGFTTGSQAGGYVLSSVELDVSQVPDTPADVTIALWSATSASEPDASVATLTHSTGTWATGVNTFNAPADTELDANTTYFVHVVLQRCKSQSELLNLAELTSVDAASAAGLERRPDGFQRKASGNWGASTGHRRVEIQNQRPPIRVD